MKVALIMPTHFDSRSVIAGGERYAFELASALSKKTPTTLFTFDKDAREVKHQSLTVQYCKPLFFLDPTVNPVSFAHLRALGAFDVIHCLQFKTITTEAALIWGKWLKKKTFVTDLAGGTIHSFSRFLKVEKFVDRFLYISKFNRNINGAISNPFEIIYGGVDTERFQPAASKIAAKRILYAGRIFPAKGLHILIEALPEDCSLDIVGQCFNDSYLAQLKELSRGKRVIFHGALTDDELISKYQQASIAVFPSLADGGFTSAMEAMACGVPVITSRLGSLPEIIDEGITGFLVPPNDSKALNGAIKQLLADSNQIPSMSRNCRDAAIEKFTWDKTAERCLSAYRSVNQISMKPQS